MSWQDRAYHAILERAVRLKGHRWTMFHAHLPRQESITPRNPGR